MAINRLTPIISWFNAIDDLEKPLFFHKYPPLSRVWCVIFMTFVWSFDPRYTLSYILMLFLVLFSLGHKSVSKRIDPILQRLFWDHPNPYYRPKCQIMTLDQINYNKDMQLIKEESTKGK